MSPERTLFSRSVSAPAFGQALAPQQRTTIDELVRHGGTAMYELKTRHRLRGPSPSA